MISVSTKTQSTVQKQTANEQHSFVLNFIGDEYNNAMFRLDEDAISGVWTLTQEDIAAIGDLGRILEDMFGYL